MPEQQVHNSIRVMPGDQITIRALQAKVDELEKAELRLIDQLQTLRKEKGADETIIEVRSLREEVTTLKATVKRQDTQLKSQETRHKNQLQKQSAKHNKLIVQKDQRHHRSKRNNALTRYCSEVEGWDCRFDCKRYKDPDDKNLGQCAYFHALYRRDFRICTYFAPHED